jgi:hypothetical protein
MLIAAIILFFVAAVFGLVLLIAILQDRPTHKVAMTMHGCIAVLAIALIVIYMFMSGSSALLIASLILFIFAALGGVTLASFDLNNKKIPKLIAVLHPLIAIAGLIVLIVYVLP